MRVWIVISNEVEGVQDDDRVRGEGKELDREAREEFSDYHGTEADSLLENILIAFPIRMRGKQGQELHRVHHKKGMKWNFFESRPSTQQHLLHLSVRLSPRHKS